MAARDLARGLPTAEPRLPLAKFNILEPVRARITPGVAVVAEAAIDRRAIALDLFLVPELLHMTVQIGTLALFRQATSCRGVQLASKR